MLSIDQETGRPEGAGRWPLRRAPLPLTAVDSVAFSLTTIAVLAFAAVVLVKGPPETLVYAHCVLLAALVLAGTNARLTHPNHVKCFVRLGAAILTARIAGGKGSPVRLYPIAFKDPSGTHIGQVCRCCRGGPGLVRAVSLDRAARFGASMAPAAAVPGRTRRICCARR